MFKKIIRPFQEVLLERKLCVGCTHPLTKAKLETCLIIELWLNVNVREDMYMRKN